MLIVGELVVGELALGKRSYTRHIQFSANSINLLYRNWKWEHPNCRARNHLPNRILRLKPIKRAQFDNYVQSVLLALQSLASLTLQNTFNVFYPILAWHSPLLSVFFLFLIDTFLLFFDYPLSYNRMERDQYRKNWVSIHFEEIDSTFLCFPLPSS